MEKMTQKKAKAILEHIVKKNLLSCEGLSFHDVSIMFKRYTKKTGKQAKYGINTTICFNDKFSISNWLMLQNKAHSNKAGKVFLQRSRDWSSALSSIMKNIANGRFATVAFWMVADSSDSIEKALVEMDLDGER